MNANELAEIIEHLENARYIGASKAASMLRQQQAKIEALKKEAALQRLSDFTQEADNEPVAWMFEKDGAYMCIKHDNRVNYDGGIPLYAHPVKEQLTDAITLFEKYADKLEDERPNKGLSDVVLECVEILRKLQEK